jgi:DNA invertase Pin-like site-specific DNA recombinase
MIYGYIRVSTDRQTVENQRFEINGFCERNVMVVDKWIEETISGTKKQFRNGNLVNSSKKMKKEDILICSELSRLGRNLLMMRIKG